MRMTQEISVHELHRIRTLGEPPYGMDWATADDQFVQSFTAHVVSSEGAHRFRAYTSTASLVTLILPWEVYEAAPVCVCEEPGSAVFFLLAPHDIGEAESNGEPLAVGSLDAAMAALCQGSLDEAAPGVVIDGYFAFEFIASRRQVGFIKTNEAGYFASRTDEPVSWPVSASDIWDELRAGLVETLSNLVSGDVDGVDRGHQPADADGVGEG